MEKGRAFEAVVGVVVLIVAVFFFNYVYKRSSWQSVDGYSLIAKFDSVIGLSEGGEVKISGIRVGKINQLTVDPQNFLAVVKLRINKNIRLPIDTSAAVVTDGLLGGKYLAINPGNNEEEYLEEGDEIQDTVGPINIESLIGKVLFSKNDKK